MPRFVVLEHDHPDLHWDLLLEHGEALRAWRLLAIPDSAESIVAEALPDHRALYLDYEGPVGGDRGHVARWDAGTFEERPGSTSNTVRDETKRLELHLAGSKLRGRFVLECISSDQWRFYCPPA